MKKTAFIPLTVRELRPLGWLREQLLLQAKGLCGNLDKVWPDIRDSRWVGGDREGWERVPYWLDGFIPLAYLLDDADLKARAKRYIDAILEGQQEDGWICPCTEEERPFYDLWALILIAKVLTVYADCSGDSRIEGVLSRALQCFSRHLDRRTLFDWGASRWFEALIPIFWLYERTEEAWLLALAHKLEVQGVNYEALFAHYADEIPQRHWTFLTHVVNMAMCLKQGALTSRLYGGDPDAFAELAFATLKKHHGMAVGHFSGDECVAGWSPVRGTELCGVVEAMYSYETLLAVGGSPKWGDELERLAFNALPAALSEDLWAHQYDQMTNQVQCTPLPEGKVPFGTNGPESHLFGLEPNFGCCTANFGQGWPKFALSTFMRTETGLASTVLAPSEASVTIRGVPVTCRLETDYPFRGRLTYRVTAARPVAFPLSIRIPACAKSALVDGAPAAPGAFSLLDRTWEGETAVTVELAFEPVFTQRPGGLYCLWRGPLLYSLPIRARAEKREYIRDGVERKFPYCDYALFPLTPWGYGFAGGSVTCGEHPLAAQSFSQSAPPITLHTQLAPIPWRLIDGVCAEQPDGLTPTGPAEELALIPYGCAKLRMTELPLLKNTSKL